MKITRIDTFKFWVDWCNWLFVRVSTDEGLVGWGEGSLHGAIESVETAIHEYAPHLVGQDPAGPERHWHRLYHAWRWRGGAVLHDGAGRPRHRACGISRASGSACRSRGCWAARSARSCAAYASHWLPGVDNAGAGRTTARGRRCGAASPRSSAARSRYEGLRDNEAGEIRRAAALIGAAREGGRARRRDLHRVQRVPVAAHGRAARRGARPYRPGWFEEPIPFENAKAMAQLQRQISDADRHRRAAAVALRVPRAPGERRLPDRPARPHARRRLHRDQQDRRAGRHLLRPGRAA